VWCRKGAYIERNLKEPNASLRQRIRQLSPFQQPRPNPEWRSRDLPANQSVQGVGFQILDKVRRHTSRGERLPDRRFVRGVLWAERDRLAAQVRQAPDLLVAHRQVEHPSLAFAPGPVRRGRKVLRLRGGEPNRGRLHGRAFVLLRCAWLVQPPCGRYGLS
jgi:hypothetical protein